MPDLIQLAGKGKSSLGDKARPTDQESSNWQPDLEGHVMRIPMHTIIIAA